MNLLFMKNVSILTKLKDKESIHITLLTNVDPDRSSSLTLSPYAACATAIKSGSWYAQLLMVPAPIQTT